MDVIGLVIPKASNGHEYILVAIDYFTKWVEVTSYKNVTQAMVAWFLKHNIICRYSVPTELITDNGMNGALEAVNMSIKKILVKMTDTYKDWYKYFSFALCAYRTSVRTSTGATLYSLIYGMEALVLAEIRRLDGSGTQGKKTPPRLLSVYDAAMSWWSAQDVLAHANGKFTSMGKGKDLSRT
ncbi:uncharacterized protein LOC142605787 [Castanea sativa]|uniref:uncharacterized protein LOC142605787 n=1 Tax=Castanea sativa TaxID=21020 RepID=UPI003F64C6B4